MKKHFNIQLFADGDNGTATNRANVELPKEVSQEIIQKTQEESAVMGMARKITLPGRGLTIPEILADPEPAWVSETELKPVSNPQIGKKDIQGYTLAVIVPFSNQFRRDYNTLFNACVARLPRALGSKFDNTCFGGTAAPGENFDTFGEVTGVDITQDAYAGLVAADTAIAVAGGITDGYVISPQAKGILLSAKDDNQRPLFINSVAEGAIPMILGTPTKLSRGVYVEGTPATAASGTEGQEGYVPASAGVPATVGVCGDWTKAVYGIVEAVTISLSDQATLKVGNDTIYLWQQNMFAVRAEIEIGFRADTSKFVRLLGNVPTGA